MILDPWRPSDFGHHPEHCYSRASVAGFRPDSVTDKTKHLEPAGGETEGAVRYWLRGTAGAAVGPRDSGQQRSIAVPNGQPNLQLGSRNRP
jgi:hypothetical protein